MTSAITAPVSSRLAGFRSPRLGAGLLAGAGTATLFFAAQAFGFDASIPGIDEELVRAAAHFTVYGALAMLVAIALGHWRLLAWTIVMLAATAEELHQLFVPGRYAGVSDWLTNAAGITVFLLLSGLWSHLAARRAQARAADAQPAAALQ
jgi:hypothetical protein